MPPLGRGAPLVAFALATSSEDSPPSGIAAEPHFAPGAVVAKRFVIRERLGLGAGGLGSVYAAHDRERRGDVGLQVVPGAVLPKGGLDPSLAGRLRGLTHPGIVRIHDVLPGPGGALLVVRDLVRGRSLRRALERARRANATVHWPDARRVALELLEALGQIHAHGLTHAFIRPETVLIDEDGRVRLSGLVVSQVVSGEHVRARVLALDAAYLAPELEQNPGAAEAQRDVRRQADLYAVGMLLCELLLGAAPDGRAPPPLERSRSDLPRGIDRLVAQALAPRVADRFADAQAMVDGIQGLGPARPSGERRAPIVPERDRSRPLLRLAVLLALVALVFGVAALLASPPDPAASPTQATSRE